MRFEVRFRLVEERRRLLTLAAVVVEDQYLGTTHYFLAENTPRPTFHRRSTLLNQGHFAAISRIESRLADSGKIGQFHADVNGIILP